MIRLLIIVLLLSSCGKKTVPIETTHTAKMPTITLDGSKSYSATAIVSYRWYQISGASVMTFDNPYSPKVRVNSSKPSVGTNIIGLEIKDKTGQIGTGQSFIIVTK